MPIFVMLFDCVTVMSIIGLNLLLHMTSRAEGAAISTVRPNLFVNFSAPHQRIVKVSVRHISETGMVPQRHHSLALLPNYNTGRLTLNSPEDSAAEVADPSSIEILPKEDRYLDRTTRITSERYNPHLAEYMNAENEDPIANTSDDHGGEDKTYKSDENLSFWMPTNKGSEEHVDRFADNTDESNPPIKVATENRAAVPKVNYSSDPNYFNNDSENTADTDDDQSQYFVKVKTKPRDAFVGLGFSSAPVPQSIEPDFLITAAENPLHPSLNLNAKSAGPKQFGSSENLSNFGEDKLTIVPNFINTHSRDVEPVKVGEKELFPPTPVTPLVDLIAGVTQTTESTSIPGMAGIDYPILGEVPSTGFDCQKQRYKGFFADVDTKCQAWHYCDFTDGHSTFLCPNGTLFSQVLLTCDWWFNVDCRQAQQLYVLNERLYRYIKAPKLSFPEDYHGPQVDDWLLEQLNLGLLPKMKKIVTDKMVIQDTN